MADRGISRLSQVEKISDERENSYAPFSPFLFIPVPSLPVRPYRLNPQLHDAILVFGDHGSI